jgi:hypothetical protein
VLHQAALRGGLAGGDDGELCGAVGGGDDAGGEMLVGVEAVDRGHAVEADAVLAFDGLGQQAELGDAGAAGEEGGFELRDSGADRGDAAQTGDDDALQLIVLLRDS